MQLLFRADGNNKIGLGHLVRCLALAEMLQPYYQCAFAVQEPSEAIIQQVQNSGCAVIELPATTNYLAEAAYLAQTYAGKFAGVILDGYYFGTDYQRAFRPFFKIFCLDDLHTIHFVADAVVNPAGNVAPENYAKEVYTKVFAGPEYALLRKPFLAAAASSRTLPAEPRVLVNMGGADPANFTVPVIHQLLQQPLDFKTEVVVGSAYQHLTSLEELARKHAGKVSIHRQLSAAAMCRLMQACRLAVLPPSTVAYEWCSVGGPLFLIRTAENQKNIENFLVQKELAWPYSEHNPLLPGAFSDPTFFSGQVRKQRFYFDGQSPNRIRQVFDQLFYPELLQVRRAQLNDLQLLFHWINDPLVRQFSLNPEPIPLVTHTAWFQYKLSDKNCYIFIAEIRQEPIGMIRFDIHQGEAIISYLIDKNFRGKGLGTLMLSAGILKFKNLNLPVKHVSGLVQKENTASIKAFTKVGFSVNPSPDKNHPHVLKFTLPI